MWRRAVEDGARLAHIVGMSEPASTPTTVRLAGVEGLLSAIPTMLGFEPSNSLVVACMSGERNRLGPIIRLDLDSLHGEEANLKRMVAQYAERAIVVVYADGEYDVAGVITALARTVEILDTIDAADHIVTPDPDLAAANALHGRRTLASREQMVNSIQFQPAADPADAAAYLAKVATTDGRDQLVLDAVADTAMLPSLIAAVRSTPNDHPHLADLAAVLAAAAYRNGDGALAQVSVDRALVAAPKHRLAHLLLEVMATGMPPDQFALTIRDGA